MQWKADHQERYGAGGTNSKICGRIKNVLELLTDMGKGTFAAFKSVWAASNVGYMKLSQWRKGNEQVRLIYPAYSCGVCTVDWCQSAHMQCHELPDGYASWMAKQMEPGVSKLLKKKSSKRPRENDGSESE